MRRLTSLMVAMGLAAGSAAAVAADLPNYDASISVLRTKVGDSLAQAKPTLTKIPATASGWHNVHDPLLGHDTFVWAPKDNAPQPVAAFKPGFGGKTNARQYLAAEGHKLGVSAAQAETARLVRFHDAKRGAIIAKFQQRVGALDVFGRQVNVMLDQNDRFVAASGYFAPADSISGNFSLDAKAAIAAAFANMGGKMTPAELRAGDQMPGGYATYVEAAGQGYALSHPVRLKQVLFPLGGKLVPAYYMELQASQPGSQDSDAYSYVVSGVDGKILFRHDLVSDATFGYRVWAEAGGDHTPLDGPFGDYLSPSTLSSPSDPAPARNVIAANLISLDHGPITTGDPWLPSSASIPDGNNADAYTDAYGGDGFNPSDGDIQPGTTSAQTFDYAYNDANGPSNAANQKATVIQAFYMVNWLHDFWYNHGFDEEAGNGQKDNFGRGGLDNDPVHVEIQDHSGRNNANMFSVTDGSAPRMQMYLFDGPTDTTVTVNQPASGLADPDPLGSAQFGPSNFDVTNDVVLIDDGSQDDSDGGSTGTVTDGCQAATNAGALSGKIALVDRGACTFVTKVGNAQDAGAVGVIIANNDDQAPDSVISMGGTDATITIPSLMISYNAGGSMKSALGSGTVNVSMHQQYQGDRDGALDGSIVAHEFFHFVSGRLVNDGNGLVNQQGGAMGEGWSDFSSLMLMTRASDLNVSGNDQLQAAYPVGDYVMSTPYFGIRRAPYSTQMSINPLTFKDIQDGVALPNSGAPLAFGLDGSMNSEVHNAGEIWTLCLWQAFAELVNDPRYAGNFSEAKDRMMNYVIAGLKMTPASPTYIEARNAILAAALANDSGDFDDIAAGFAARGMGWGAVGPDRDSSDLKGVSESYDAKQSGQGPTAKIDVASSAQVNARLTLDGTGSNDPDGGKLTYKWQVVSGPGELLEDDQASVRINLNSAGTVKVKLTVTDFEDKSDSTTTTINVTKGSSGSSSSGGGGAFGAFALLGLLGLLGIRRKH